MVWHVTKFVVKLAHTYSDMESSTEVPSGDITMLISAMDRDQLAELSMQGHKGGGFLAQFLFVRDPSHEQKEARRAELSGRLEYAISQGWSPATITAKESQLAMLDSLAPMISAWSIASRHRQITGRVEVQKAIHSLIGPSREECQKGNGRILTALNRFADARRARQAVANVRGADNPSDEDVAHAVFIQLCTELSDILYDAIREIGIYMLQPTASQRRTSASARPTLQ